jgi:transposase
LDVTIAITRRELDAHGLRAAAARAKDAAASRRMLALALVLEGHSRTEAAQAAGMDRQTLRDWVHRYNAHGLAGLTNQPNSGAPPRKLTAEQEAQVAEWVRAGPSLDEHKVVRWRCCDLRDEIARRFGVEMHERTVGKLLARLNFSRVSVRPRHPKQDLAAQEAHKKTSPIWSPRSSPSTRAASPLSYGGKMKRVSASKAV